MPIMPLSSTPYLSVKNIDITYQHKQKNVVSDLSFELQQGEIACLLGPSGCGKTTILRAIIGFEKVQKGTIHLNQHCLSSAREHIRTEHRRIGLVFQDYALFPHLNVTQNIAFGLPKAGATRRVEELLDLVGLSDFAHKYPHEMSGGQQQRVALARALAPKPSLLLLDEPFSSLDIELRQRLAQDIRAILKRTQTTALLVTHDQHEAFTMADTIGVIQQGKLLQWAAPETLYHAPNHPFVAEFIGESNQLPIHISTTHAQSELGQIPIHNLSTLSSTSSGIIYLRPEELIFCEQDPSATTATIIEKHFRGQGYYYRIALDSGLKLGIKELRSTSRHIGDKVKIKLHPATPVKTFFKTINKLTEI